MWRERVLRGAALAAIIAVALLLRTYALDWDEGQWVHPDERMILMVTRGRISLPTGDQLGLLLTPQSPLNPAFHAYGSLPIYLLKAAQLAVGDRLPLHLAARYLAVLFDCGTVLLVYGLAAALAGGWWGVLAASLIAIAPIHVQLAHYYTVDTLLAFWTALSAFMAVRLLASGKRRWLVGLAVVAGLAAATKLVGAALLLFLWLALFTRAWQRRPGSLKRPLLLATRTAVAGSALAGIIFVLADPYAAIDGWAFVGEVASQAMMARGDSRFPYTLQFAGTLPYIYPIWQNLTRGWGIGAGLLLWSGLGWGLVGLVKSRLKQPAWATLTIWTVAFFAAIGSWHTKFPRYLLPTMPLMAALGAGLMASLWRRSRRAAWRWVLGFLAAALVAMSTLYTLSLESVFSRQHPWIGASEWIYEHVPRGAKVATEYWDMALPLPLEIDGQKLDRGRYDGVELDLYPTDVEEKWRALAEQVASRDYIIVATPRVFGPVGLLARSYPMTARFYTLLFEERLGFRLATWAANDQSLLGWRFVENPFARARLPVPEAIWRDWSDGRTVLLGGADESWTVYDRPLTMIFRNEAHLSAEQIFDLVAR